ncbi:MAG: CDP-glucose 4,6-dehydratase [Bacteroidales bacterium]|nr:CDP-glucose 4,6-dehydratase [Bacteroidales bacterium]
MAINYTALHDFYRGKTVLVTGHTGFKGSWLSIWLHSMGARVIGYSLDPLSSKDNFVLAGGNELIKDIRADVRDLNTLTAVINEEKPDIVLHLAAQALVISSYREPVDTYASNIMGTVNLLEACRLNEMKRSIVVVTSDKCYENKEWVFPYRESDPMGGHDPYSSSKGAAELVTASYRNSFLCAAKGSQQRVATARAGNVIGGGDWALNRLIPDCVRAMESDSPLMLRNPGSTRPWQHVLEPLSGYLLLAMKNYQQEGFSEAWNFGPGLSGTFTVQEVVEKFYKLTGRGEWMQDGIPEFHEAKLLALDISKTFNLLGWQPTLNFEQMLKLTAEWYDNYNKTFSVLELCKKQIHYFESNAC